MSHDSPIAVEGLPFIGISFVLTLVAYFLGLSSLGFLLTLVTLFILWFFRNPQRTIPTNPRNVVSPADGKIIRIEEIENHDLYPGPSTKISIFMNVFNVHVNRAPCAGQVEAIRYDPGRFLSANLDKASAENERNAVLIKMPDGRRLLTIQIAGLIARRIVCWVAPGVQIGQGERFGMIRFGSRLEVFMPRDTRTLVVLGQKVRAGNRYWGN
jgi:phosphatidylserine decarboxylase